MSSRPTAEYERTSEIPVFADGESILHEMRDIFGRKWQPVLLYRLLDDGPMGFSTLKRRVDGISSKMLSESLSELVEARLVEREELNDSPMRVEYRLTDRGETLEPVLAEMVKWGTVHAVSGQESPRKPDTFDTGGENTRVSSDSLRR